MWKHRLRGINEKEFKAICDYCGPVRIRWRKDRKRWVCSKAESDWNKNRPKNRKRTRRKAPIGTCAICSIVSKLHRDHDHKTGIHRGLICIFCNLGLGLFKDSPSLLNKAALYLNKNSPANQ